MRGLSASSSCGTVKICMHSIWLTFENGERRGYENLPGFELGISSEARCWLSPSVAFPGQESMKLHVNKVLHLPKEYVGPTDVLFVASDRAAVICV